VRGTHLKHASPRAGPNKENTIGLIECEANERFEQFHVDEA
jgi:hypothetical protein